MEVKEEVKRLKNKEKKKIARGGGYTLRLCVVAVVATSVAENKSAP